MKAYFLPFLFSAFFTFVATATADDHQKGPDPLRISHGAEVNLADYLVPGKTTIFDFTSKYCPPCQAISPKLDELHKKRDDIAVVKIDINREDTKKIDWQSPVAQQYKLHSIPHFKIYSPEGKLVAEDKKASEIVYGWVK
jgi:thiol-disulfide isomerase/thioredoxin